MSNAKVTISLSSADLLPQTLSLRASRQLTIGGESAFGTSTIATGTSATIYTQVSGGVGASDITYILVSADSENASEVTVIGNFTGAGSAMFFLPPGGFLWLPIYNAGTGNFNWQNGTGSPATVYYYFGERE